MDTNGISVNKGEIVMYQPDETIRLEVRLENDTVWLNRQQIAQLFGRDVKTIGKHINNALQEELRTVPTVAKLAIVQKEGNPSFKDLGRRLFAFELMGIDKTIILSQL